MVIKWKVPLSYDVIIPNSRHSGLGPRHTKVKDQTLLSLEELKVPGGLRHGRVRFKIQGRTILSLSCGNTGDRRGVNAGVKF